MLIIAVAVLATGTTHAQLPYYHETGTAENHYGGPWQDGDDGFWHPQGLPPGLPGSYNNPVRVRANLGEQVTLGDFQLGNDPWYVVTGWFIRRQAEVRFTFYYDLFGPHRGQFLNKTAEAFDFPDYGNEEGIVYAAFDAAHGGRIVFFRVIKRPPPSGSVLEP